MAFDEIIVDSFAGGGGASTGIEMALGRSPDVAINHSAAALALHRANHPETEHLCNDIWGVDPSADVARGRKIGLLWASPDCKHFSKAKGGSVRDRNVRDLAWVVCRYAELPRAERPRVIILENVEEFITWGPVGEDGQPIAELRGLTFEAWVKRLRAAGYRVQWRELRACDYGAPTIRKRLFVIARSDGQRIVWPKPTHGDPKRSPAVKRGKLQPWLTAAEIIDWSLPCHSIFDTAEEIMAKHGVRARRPLADATLRRIARGVVRYVLNNPRPFVMTMRAATMVQTGYGERPGQAPRSLDIEAPIGTQVAGGAKHAVVAAFLAQHNTGVVGHEIDKPLSTVVAVGQFGISQQAVVAANLIKFNGNSTGADLEEPAPTITANSFVKRPGGAAPIGLMAANLAHLRGTGEAGSVEAPLWTQTAGGTHASLVAAFLTKYYGTDQDPRLDEPMHTDTTKPRFGLVTVEIEGQTYAIVDIGMRMLTPRERFRAQGFPDGYQIATGIDENGRPVNLTVAQQGSCVGNSVCPDLAAALVSANCADMAVGPSRYAAE